MYILKISKNKNFLFYYFIIKGKKAGEWMSLYCTVGYNKYRWMTIMDDIKF